MEWWFPQNSQTLFSCLSDCYPTLLMVAILAQVLFSFSGRGGGSAMARVLFPLRAQIGTLSSGARLSFLLHLFLEIECGFLDNLGPFVCLQLDMAGSKDVIDRVLLEERHKQAGTLALSFPWEQGIRDTGKRSRTTCSACCGSPIGFAFFVCCNSRGLRSGCKVRCCHRGYECCSLSLGG